MAVYTHLTDEQIGNFLSSFRVGEFVSAQGIPEGIDNTNYKIETRTDKFILTIFENRIDPNDLPYFLELMDHFSRSGIFCPAPVKDKNGEAILTIEEKPCALFTFIDGHGTSPEEITPDLCSELGTLLGKMHLAGMNTRLARRNSMGPDAWESRIKKTEKQGANYLEELNFLKQNWPQDLPAGNVHADLFPDNIFIRDNHIYGVIDFYFSCTDFLAYDLAIVMNAWCFDMEWNFVSERWDSLLSSYEEIRPLTKEEKDAYQILCRGAAMRFLSSRLHDLVFHDPRALVTPKNPDEYIRKLDFHRDHKLF